MKPTKRLISSLILSGMILAACSGLPLTLSFPRQTSPDVAVAAATIASQPAQALPTSTNPVQPTQVPTTTNPPATAAPAVIQPAAVKDPTSAQAVQIPSSDLSSMQGAFETIYQNVNPSVVSIQVVEQAPVNTGRRRFQNFGPQVALGSGFVWDKQGDIVTNNHVISGATSITVTFADGTTVDATLVGADPNADLAVVKVNVPASQLEPVQVADSTQAKVGDIVIAIGNPYGLQNTMTQGIISALSRTLPVGLDNSNGQSGSSYQIPDIIQTDASINPGNSGGVLVDIQGRLIGVPSAIESSTQASAGIGFVIPSEIVNKVVPSLIKIGSYEHPWLGFDGTDLTAAIAKAMNLDTKTRGALVTDVTPGGSAAKAGLRAGSQAFTAMDGTEIPIGGDVITAINGQTVNGIDAVSSYLFIHTMPGDKVTLTLLRQGKPIEVTLTVGVLPAQ